MITDRTQADVTYAKNNPNSSEDLKGAYNNSDLNRVESKVSELKTLFENYGYSTGITEIKTNWTKTDFFVDGSRYLLNVRKLKNILPELPNTPELPDTINNLTYEQANNIEQILVNTETLINNVISAIRYSNTFYAGESEGIL